jgi:Zn ribbon nucleic-acid-binding protein
MAQARKGRLNYRCPACFMRDIDIDMFFDQDKNEYYCLRCNYKGNEEDVLVKNQMARFRYRYINKRITKFIDDKD